MTPLDKWLAETAAEVAKDDAEAMRECIKCGGLGKLEAPAPQDMSGEPVLFENLPDCPECAGTGKLVTQLEQRIAIALAQARAAECRNLSGQLQIHGLVKDPVFNGMARYLVDRSSQLEQWAMEMIKTYPPDHAPPKPQILSPI